jgi:hypothetical protein
MRNMIVNEMPSYSKMTRIGLELSCNSNDLYYDVLGRAEYAVR